MRVERWADLAALRDDWARLTPRENVFATWEWAEAWSRHLGGDSELALGVMRGGDGTCAAILPLAVEHRLSLRMVRFVGSGPADQLGPIHAGGVAPDEIGSALRRHVQDTLVGSGLFLGERLWGREPLGRELSDAVIHRVPSPVLPIRDRSYEEFLSSRSRNFRSQVRRRERRLREAGRVSYRLTEDPDRLEGDMHTLMRLHVARWGGQGAFGGARRAFHLAFARHALRRGWLRLWILELDGRPVAAWYGLRYGGVELYYQAGRDPGFDALHVGFVLLNHTIRCAFEDGMREYRFGRGGEPYKMRFAEQDPGLDTLAIAAGARAELALAGVKAALRLPEGARRTVRSALGQAHGLGTGRPVGV